MALRTTPERLLGAANTRRDGAIRNDTRPAAPWEGLAAEFAVVAAGRVNPYEPLRGRLLARARRLRREMQEGAMRVHAGTEAEGGGAAIRAALPSQEE